MGALGAAADQLLIRRLKHRLYDRLLGLWTALEDSRVADLPAAAASFALARLQARKASGSRVATAAKVVVISLALTTVSAIVGRLVRRYTFPWYEARALEPSLGLVDAAVTHTQWLYDKLWLYCPAFLVNFVFDIATVMVTVWALREVCRTDSALRRYAMISLNVGIAFVLAIASLGIADWVVISGTFLRQMQWAAECIVAVLTWDTSGRFASGFDNAFVGLSTLIPISLYLLILALTIQAKAVLVALRSVSLYWLEVAVEPLPKDIDSRFKPFTLIGLVFATFGIVAKAAFELAGARP